jgi:hypothetical protein
MHLALEATLTMGRLCPSLSGLLALVLSGATALGQDDQALRDHHVWGRFAAGSWRKVQVVTETLDAEGNVGGTTITETKTTLTKVDSQGISLRIEVTVEVDGKRFDAEPQTVEQCYHGLPRQQVFQVRALEPETVTVEGRQIPCDVREVTTVGGPTKTIAKVYYTERVPPFLLRRESTTTDPQDPQVVEQLVHEVIALDMPYKLNGQIKSTALERTVQTTRKGTIQSLDITCIEVPGGTIHRTTKELDAQGRLVRRSTVELLDYSAQRDDRAGAALDRRGMLRRRDRR